MTRFWPKTLKIRITLILCVFFLLSHVASLIIYENNRGRTVLLTEATDLAARIAGIVNLASGFPSEDRQQILTAAETQFLTMFPVTEGVDENRCESNAFSDRISQFLNQELDKSLNVVAEVCLREVKESWLFNPIETPRGLDVVVSIDFPDSNAVIFHTLLPEGESLLRDAVLIYLLISFFAALLIAWYLIQKTVVPLERLADAANKIGSNIDMPPLNESGPKEVALAASAFNQMQDHIQQLVHGQTEMLGAISHDLRSAVTRLQLRTELLTVESERTGMLRVTHDMSLMIQSVLDFIRGIDSNEPLKNMDISALVESLCDDLSEEGYPITFTGEHVRFVMACRPVAFRRGLNNLIDNAIKYGHEARASIERRDNNFVIIIEDSGPGIPEEQLDLVLKPFYRLEKSRNSATGGVGLGLSVAENVFLAHGAKLTLKNREPNGLAVEIEFGPAITTHR